MSKYEENLSAQGIILPTPAAPVANYVGFVKSGNQVIISGQLPLADGKLQYVGKVGSEISKDDAIKAARLCAINILAQLKSACDGDLSKVVKCIKLGIFVNGDADFTDHPIVANGASDLMVEIFGEAGKHARAAVGSGSLPLGASVEIDALFEIKYMNSNLHLADIIQARDRIKDHIKNTPLISNDEINKKLGAQIFFKMENQQEANSFKARGAFNAILSYKEKHGEFPKKIVTSSSGNHAQAIALASKKFGIKARIHMMKTASKFKIAATRNLGAKVKLHDKRSDANNQAKEEGKNGWFFIHPSQSDEVICGQGTAALEALEKLQSQNIQIDASFTPCGGGGLASGTFIVVKEKNPAAKIFSCEPQEANDAVISLRENKIFKFDDTPDSIADGARTLAISENTFRYFKKMDGVLEIEEDLIAKNQQELSEILDQKIEPTSALAFIGAKKFLKKNSELKNPKILVIISGGNVKSCIDDQDYKMPDNLSIKLPLAI